MPLPHARYRLIDWPAGPQVEYDDPAQVLGWSLSNRNMTLGLERMLADLRSDDDASSGNLATRAYRSGELVRLCGEWGPEEIELPLSEFCTAAEEFLEWIRSQPAAKSHDMWVVLASWLVGGITADDAARQLHTRPGEDSETLLRRLVARFGDEGRQETFENLASTIAVSVANLEIDPRVGAAAIAGLAAGMTDANTELALLIQPFVALSATARDAEGRPALVAEAEHRIAAAAAQLGRARTRL